MSTTDTITAEELREELADYCDGYAASVNWEQASWDIERMGGLDEIDFNLALTVLVKNNTALVCYGQTWTPCHDGCVCDGSWDIEDRYLLLEEPRPSERVGAEDPEFEARALNHLGRVVSVYWNDVVDAKAAEDGDWAGAFAWDHVDRVDRSWCGFEDVYQVHPKDGE